MIFPSTDLKDLAACQLVTRLGEDVLALEIANKSLENSGIMLQLPGLVRLYEVVTADMAAPLKELEQTVDT
jgi:hypothetical protein